MVRNAISPISGPTPGVQSPKPARELAVPLDMGRLNKEINQVILVSFEILVAGFLVIEEIRKRLTSPP